MRPKKSGEKDLSDFDQARLQSQFQAWKAQAEVMQAEVKKNYIIRMEKMADLLLRWVGYNELTMADYKSFHPDAKDEGELENLVQMSKDLTQVRYEDMKKYFEVLVDFFNFTRARLVNVNKGDKVLPTFTMSDLEIGDLVKKIQKVDELRKKIP